MLWAIQRGFRKERQPLQLKAVIPTPKHAARAIKPMPPRVRLHCASEPPPMPKLTNALPKPMSPRAIGTLLNCSWFQFQLSNVRSEEHTSELISRLHLVCRLLL